MNFLHKMERKFGKYAIRHLTIYIIITYVTGYLPSCSGEPEPITSAICL